MTKISTRNLALTVAAMGVTAGAVGVAEANGTQAHPDLLGNRQVYYSACINPGVTKLQRSAGLGYNDHSISNYARASTPCGAGGSGYGCTNTFYSSSGHAGLEHTAFQCAGKAGASIRSGPYDVNPNGGVFSAETRLSAGRDTVHHYLNAVKHGN
jgi:hypothetical protein